MITPTLPSHVLGILLFIVFGGFFLKYVVQRVNSHKIDQRRLIEFLYFEIYYIKSNIHSEEHEVKFM